MRDMFIYSEQIKNRRKSDVKDVLSKSSPAVVLTTEEGILMITQNRDVSTEKIFNIYDKVSCAMIGDLEDISLIRAELIRESTTLGDLTYSPNEVTAEVLSKAVSKLLKTTFDNFSLRPLHIETIISQVGKEPSKDQIYKVAFDGRITKSPLEIIGNYGKNNDGDQFLTAINSLSGIHAVDEWTNKTALDKIIGAMSANRKWEIKYMDRAKLKERGEFDNVLITICSL